MSALDSLTTKTRAHTDLGCLYLGIMVISCSIKTLIYCQMEIKDRFIVMMICFTGNLHSVLSGKLHPNSLKSLCFLSWGIAVPCCGSQRASEEISAPTLDWHIVVSLSSSATELKGQIPWRLAACGETVKKKDLSVPHSLFGCLLEANRTEVSLSMLPALKERNDLQMLCKSICLN